MYCNSRRMLLAVLLSVSALTIEESVQGQNSVSASSRPAVTVLDSTKEQDGLKGSVRRVKTETAKIELKDGIPVEGPAQLVEVTTYGIKGNRIENTSYPIGGSLVGKEEYKYDERGNITGMTLRDESGGILSREAYSYEFDKFGNWTKMVTSLVVFENGELKREPVEVTYRTVTYYFDESIAKIVDAPNEPIASPIPEPAAFEIADVEILKVDLGTSSNGRFFASSLDLAGDPPALLTKRLNRKKGNAVSDLGNNQTDTLSQSNGSMVSSAGARGATSETPAPPASRNSLAAKSNAAEKALEASNIEGNSTAVVVPVTEPATTSNVTNQQRANDYYKAGRDRFEVGDLGAAVEAYLQSIKLEPKSAEVYLNLGHAYLRMEKDREAIKAFKESIKLNPTVAEAQYGLGFVCFRMGRFRDAATAFKSATSLNPQMAKAHYGLSLAYQELGDLNALLAEYRILERLDRSLAKKLAQTFPQYNFSCRFTNGCQ